MTADQMFILGLVTTGLTFLSTVVMGFVAYLTAKIRNEAKGNATNIHVGGCFEV